MNDREAIRRHYNERHSMSRQEREATRAYHIRNFNNFIKSMLFKIYLDGANSVLDFGFGKGGDLWKYEKTAIKEVYGLDIANVSLIEALERARSMRPPFKLVVKTKDCYGSSFDLKKEFDAISIQFSFHYCFKSEATLETTLGNISRHLKNRGIVIMTVPCKEEILRRKEKGTLSNPLYSIQFKEYDERNPYNQAYSISISDSIDKCVEYLIDYDVLENKAREKNLFIIKSMSFRQFLDSNYDRFYDLYKRQCRRELTDDENDVVNLYDIVVLEKRL